MNKSFKPVITLAVLAVFGVANAQQPAAQALPAPKPAVAAPAPATPAPAPAPAAAPTPAPAAVAPTPTPAPAPAPAAAAPAPAPAPAVAPAAAPKAATPAPAPAPAAVAPTPAPAPAPAAAAPTPAPAPAPAAAAPAPAPAPAAAAPTPAPAPAPAAVAPAPAPAPAPVAEAQAPKADSTIVLIVEQPKKKKRAARTPKNDFAVVDVPANFEIQAKKNMPLAERPSGEDAWGDDNLDTWWGRANLMVLTESENFVGKVHLRMYPGQLYGQQQPLPESSVIKGTSPDRYGNGEIRDAFQLYEAWAWHRGDYVNIKLGRWDNTTRFGSHTFGGYVDAKRDRNDTELYDGHYENKQENNRPDVDTRANRLGVGFMSTYTPENAIQFGLNNFSENISLDIALISGDNHLNRGDLRIYFSFKDLAGLEDVDIGLGYRSNVFDEIYNKRGDVTHTVDFGFRLPLAKEIGILKNINLFAEAALIGLDDQFGDESRADQGGSPSECKAAFPILGGLDISLYQGLDNVVIEAEYDGDRAVKAGYHAKDIMGSIYVQKKLNDRFTLNLGVQSENNTKDFSFAGRLQGRIN